MSKAAISPGIAHGSFTIERTFEGVTPQRVFEAFATPEAKAGWFAAPNDEWTTVEREFDFRVGGRERLKGRWKSGLITEFDARYFDIVPGERIIYAYDMWHDQKKLSVSLATFEFNPAPGGGTHFRMNEQGAFLDGYDDNGSREHGSGKLVDNLARYLAGTQARKV
ncbi:MAG TPA: SRPBCC family protein [Xanthobacteraceae bacterium]|jgi:uncharacterized protein YndB with AHSA1/START domain|nr:SRPBCC family protein [Xanthobacteraceae bacterium]